MQHTALEGPQQTTGALHAAEPLGKMARTAAMKAACGEAWSKGTTLNVISPGPVEAI